MTTIHPSLLWYLHFTLPKNTIVLCLFSIISKCFNGWGNFLSHLRHNCSVEQAYLYQKKKKLSFPPVLSTIEIMIDLDLLSPEKRQTKYFWTTCSPSHTIFVTRSGPTDTIFSWGFLADYFSKKLLLIQHMRSTKHWPKVFLIHKNNFYWPTITSPLSVPKKSISADHDKDKLLELQTYWHSGHVSTHASKSASQ